MPLDGLDADDALMLRLVRQHRRPGDVADGVDARNVRAAQSIGHDRAAIDLHAELLQPEIFDVADNAHRRNQALGGDRLRGLAIIDGGGDGIGALLHLCDLGAGQNLDALLLEALARMSRDLRILDRQDLRQHFHHRDLRAHGAIERGEFDADGARAHDEERFRHRLRLHGLEIGPDQLSVRLDSGKRTRPRAGRHDDVLGLIGSSTERALGRRRLRLHRGLLRLADDDFAGLRDARLAPDHVDLVLLHQHADAAVETPRHAARALHDGGRVEADLLGHETVILGVIHVVIDLGGTQQRLGGNAAPVQADAAHVLALHDRGLEPELRRPDRRDVAARPAADDDDVVWGLLI